MPGPRRILAGLVPTSLLRSSAVRGGGMPYPRVMGPGPIVGESVAMTHGLGRAISLATVSALLLALVAIGPVAADDGAVVRVKAAEAYAMKLLNCTRTGGWVKADGSCIGRGSGKYSAHRKPLRMHKNISHKVAWPWARNMVIHNACDHVIAGKPGLSQRLRNKGFRHGTMGENVGCGWGYGDPMALVLASHRSMQAEKSYRGGHWKNIKSLRYKSVGVGVATRDGRTMVVWDFYGKRY